MREKGNGREGEWEEGERERRGIIYPGEKGNGREGEWERMGMGEKGMGEKGNGRKGECERRGM